MLTRTTIRLQSQLKKRADILAVKKETTFQDIMNQALKMYLQWEDQIKAKKKIKLSSIELGEPLDNLTRDDIYD